VSAYAGRPRRLSRTNTLCHLCMGVTASQQSGSISIMNFNKIIIIIIITEAVRDRGWEQLTSLSTAAILSGRVAVMINE